MRCCRSSRRPIAGAAERVGPSVVGLGRGWGLGSGVVVDEGRVLTNAHNLRREEPTVTFADGRRATGPVLAGVDRDLDLAVIEVDTGDAPPVGLGTRGRRAAIGSAGARARQPRRARAARDARLRLGRASGASAARAAGGSRGAIEHTAPLPRGSSGGPLRRPRRRAARDQRGPPRRRPDPRPARRRRAARAHRRRWPAARRPPRPRLGVAVAPPRVARRMRRAVGLPERDGLLVRAVEDGSPADRAGLERGDLIVAAAGDRRRRRRRAATPRSTRCPRARRSPSPSCAAPTSARSEVAFDEAA